MNSTADKIRRQFIDFFVKKYGHKEIPSASIVPVNDPTVLFTTAGMHPLVPYLLGEPHPAGKRLVDVQKCLRTDDIDEVGDSTHLTFFEMLGNWSLGDYFKEETIKMSYELLTLPWSSGGFGLDSKRLSVSCFEGDSDAPRDTESAEIWKKVGIPEEKIYFFSKKKNWWGPAGATGPCGPDTEMFYDVLNDADPRKHRSYDAKLFSPNAVIKREGCDPSCDCGRYVEIWNDVFMQYFKKEDGTFETLKQKNVDTGLGFERLVTILHGKDSPFETELFAPAIEKIMQLGKMAATSKSSIYIIADHLRAVTFVLGDCDLVPCNVDQGYILRRLIRRAIREGRRIGIEGKFISQIAEIFIGLYKNTYPELEKNRDRIINELDKEEAQFENTLEKGIKEVQKLLNNGVEITGKDVFYIFETYGFPPEMTLDELRNAGYKDSLKNAKQEFDEAFKKHQEMSRAGAEKKFAGGLADASVATTMHHTATHMLQEALRQVLGSHVEQRGSNVTAERLRFDFSHPQKMTPEKIKKVENIVNEKITADLPVHFEMLTVEEAKQRGAIGLFEEKYARMGDKVKVYFVGDFSREICGGPHVEHTGVLKSFKILKEEASSAGVRRIKAKVDGAGRHSCESRKLM